MEKKKEETDEKQKETNQEEQEETKEKEENIQAEQEDDIQGEIEVPAKEKKAEERMGIAHIYSTYNNTIIHITDMAGNTIAQVSGGKTTKHSRLKATPTVAMFAAKRAAEIAKEQGINTLFVRVKSKARAIAPGPGSHAAVKSLSKNGMHIINILDVIPIPRGGPKIKGGKRGRRV